MDYLAALGLLGVSSLRYLHMVEAVTERSDNAPGTGEFLQDKKKIVGAGYTLIVLPGGRPFFPLERLVCSWYTGHFQLPLRPIPYACLQNSHRP